MWAPNRARLDVEPEIAERRDERLVERRRRDPGGAARMNDGRCPREVSAWSVNWLTTSTAPPDGGQVEVHAALGVREDPQRRDPAGEPLRDRLVVVRADREEDAQARARWRRPSPRRRPPWRG